MAHARRKFYEALPNDKSRAEHALTQIGKLYDIERRAKELDNESRLQLRTDEAMPVLESLGKWMKEQYVEVLPKSTIGKALGYSIERWKELIVYATDCKLNIDNNPVENSIRPVAIENLLKELNILLLSGNLLQVSISIIMLLFINRKTIFKASQKEITALYQTK